MLTSTSDFIVPLEVPVTVTSRFCLLTVTPLTSMGVKYFLYKKNPKTPARIISSQKVNFLRMMISPPKF